jgi:flagellar hook-basal body complex protein FliE
MVDSIVPPSARLPDLLLNRTSSLHMDSSGASNATNVSNALGSMAKIGSTDLGSLSATDAEGQTEGLGFDDYMLKALSGVNDSQQKASTLTQQSITEPDSVQPEQLTTAMAEASLSLSVTRTVMDRIIKAWKEVINTR